MAEVDVELPRAPLADSEEVERIVRVLVREVLAIGRRQGIETARQLCEAYIEEFRDTWEKLTPEQVGVIEELFELYRGVGPSTYATARYAILAEGVSQVSTRLERMANEPDDA